MKRSNAYRRRFRRTVMAAALLTLSGGFWSTAADAAALPDGRRYELVSPSDKAGGDVMLRSSRARASADGDAFGFASLVAFGDVRGTATSVDYIARRSAGGWATHGITPQQEPLSGILVFAGPGDAVFEGEFAPDLSKGVVRVNAFPAMVSNVSTVQNLFLRSDLLTPGPGQLDLVTDSVVQLPPPPFQLYSGYKPWFAGASEEFDHVIFESMLNLTQDAVDAGLPQGNPSTDVKLYEWTAAGVRLVGVLPEEEGGGPAARSMAGRGATLAADPSYTEDTISDDGSKIVFSTPDTGQLYMRVDGLSTVRVNASEKGVPQPTPSPAEYRGASSDGSRVFFISDEQLTDDATSGRNLWRYDANAPAGARLRQVSIDLLPADGESPFVEGVLGVSVDGAWAYFIAIGPLIADMPSVDAATPVIYAWHEGELRYVAKLFTGERAVRTNGGDPRWVLSQQTSRVTPDGEGALFVTTQEDQEEHHDHGTCGDDPCQQIYVFDAAGEGDLRCASCVQETSTQGREASFLVSRATGGAIPTSYRNHPLSDDGRYVFFHTTAALVAADHNDRSDAYAFDSQTSQVALISSGRAEAHDSYFMDASASGRDMFFATRERLVGWDIDGSYDIYDARVGGGFAEPVLPQPPCVGDACQGPIGGSPVTRIPMSGSLDGAGNVRGRATRAARRCRHGKVRKRLRGKVRCVKKRRAVQTGAVRRGGRHG